MSDRSVSMTEPSGTVTLISRLTASYTLLSRGVCVPLVGRSGAEGQAATGASLTGWVLTYEGNRRGVSVSHDDRCGESSSYPLTSVVARWNHRIPESTSGVGKRRENWPAVVGAGVLVLRTVVVEDQCPRTQGGACRRHGYAEGDAGSRHRRTAAGEGATGARAGAANTARVADLINGDRPRVARERSPARMRRQLEPGSEQANWWERSEPTRSATRHPARKAGCTRSCVCASPTKRTTPAGLPHTGAQSAVFART